MQRSYQTDISTVNELYHTKQTIQLHTNDEWLTALLGTPTLSPFLALKQQFFPPTPCYGRTPYWISPPPARAQTAIVLFFTFTSISTVILFYLPFSLPFINFFSFFFFPPPLPCFLVCPSCTTQSLLLLSLFTPAQYQHITLQLTVPVLLNCSLLSSPSSLKSTATLQSTLLCPSPSRPCTW